ncbi:MAG TPA: DivIVA domain-containing protein [Limnochordales bacterium]
MLKPRDLAKVEFKRVFRGYSEKEVDEFVEKVVAEYEKVYQRNQELEEEVQRLRARVRKYEQNEGQFEEALELARQMARDIKAAAEQRATAILAEARTQVAALLRQAREQMDAHAARVRELTRQEEAFRSRFRDLLESYWALLEEERRDSEYLSRVVQGLVDAAAALEVPEEDVFVKAAAPVTGAGASWSAAADEAEDEAEKAVEDEAEDEEAAASVALDEASVRGDEEEQRIPPQEPRAAVPEPARITLDEDADDAPTAEGPPEETRRMPALGNRLPSDALKLAREIRASGLHRRDGKR